MNRLFLDNGRMTEEGGALCSKAEHMLQAWFRPECTPYAPSEVAALLHGAVEAMRCEGVLNITDPLDGGLFQPKPTPGWVAPHGDKDFAPLSDTVDKE